MGNKNPPDERVVYLALKNVFKGPDAEVRQPKTIRKLITRSQEQAGVKDLVRAHNIDVICNTARTLLTEQVFGSTLRAKIRFPEVFDVSPAQTAEREASEAEAARNEANAIKDAVKGYQEDVEEGSQFGNFRFAVETESVRVYRAPKSSAVKGPTIVPSLFPVYLPLRTQHRVLVKVQTILEQACFDFGQQNMPDVLEKHGWDCAESAELNLWAAEFLEYRSQFEDREGATGKPLEKLFRSVADIRHSAVHRIRVSARGLEQFILDAESLATLLGDEVCFGSLRRLRRDTQLATEELERTKHVLTSQLEESLKKIAAQRAELDRLEKAAIAEMLREDGEYQLYAGTNLETVMAIFEQTALVTTATTTATVTENGTGPDGENMDGADIYDRPSSSKAPMAE